MGDSRLRCLTCGGKFGEVVADYRCEGCRTLFCLQSLLVSDRFPVAGGALVFPDLKGLYHRVLDLAESYHRSVQGGSVPPGPGDKEAKREEAQVLQTTPKARPPVKEEPARGGEAREGKPEVKEEKKESPRHEEERESPRKEKKRRDTGEAGEERARSSGIRRRRPRSPTPEEFRREHRDRKPRRGDSRQRPSPGCEGSGSRKREADRGRSRSTEIPRRPLRPRSPPGPPPPRSNPEDRWVGPIPAYQREPPPRRDRSKERKNKGAKKRRQQALFSQFKAWGRNQDREDRQSRRS